LITAMEMAVQGHGIALGRTSLAATLLESGRLIKPFDEGVATEEAFFIAIPSNKPIQSHVQAFRSWVIHQGQSARY
jgi:LysR family glycine cleavage system transcriptional activator